MTLSDAAWRQLISTIQASGPKAALAITGGGSGAIAELLRVPGGSRLMIEAQVPYDEHALASYLGYPPAQASSADTAIAMAQAAKQRAAKCVPGSDALVGLGATAALVSDRPRRGEHRYHIAYANQTGTAHCTATLAKGRRDRAAEEDLTARSIVLWLARACGVEAPSPQTLLDADEHYTETPLAASDAIDRLIGAEIDRISVRPTGEQLLTAPAPPLLLPGSFNPVHDGHTTLARIAEELTQKPASFEISVTNVDKPPLTAATVRERLLQFAGKSPVELTSAPTFLEKSRLFRATTFVIGADTAERLVAPRYYGNDPFRMNGALEEIGSGGGRFLVAVRIGAEGRVRTLNDIAVPPRFADLFTEIPESRFRMDTSSSEIRRSRT